VKDVEVLNKGIELNDNAEETEQSNITLWTVTGMLVIWLYVIIMSLF
jgi:hypothetical protein